MWTFRDAVDGLMDFLSSGGGSGSDSGRRIARQAVMAAARELAAAKRWAYYNAVGRIVTSASYSTGTVAYDHAGGDNERQLTLSDGTWPDWAAYGSVLIGSIAYEVAERKSDTVVTLSLTANPGADVAAGTSYELYRDTFPLPDDVVDIDELVSLTDQRPLTFIAPREWLNMRMTYWTPQDLIYYTVFGDPNFQGSPAVRFSPPPSAARIVEYTYHRRMRPLVTEEYSDGKVSVTANSATITGTGTAWSSRHLGASIRLSASTDEIPTGVAGWNPYIEERVVIAVNSATSITVDSAITTAYTSVKHVISDILDIHQGSMLNVFIRGCEKHMCQIIGHDRLNQAVVLFDQEMMRAMESEPRARPASGGMLHRLRSAQITEL